MAGERNGALHEKHRERMQARVERDGLGSLAEHEALEYLLFFAIPRRDTNELAHSLIEYFGSFSKVLEAPVDELMKVEGIGPKSARLIANVIAFGRYYACSKRNRRAPLKTASAAIEYAKPLFYGVQNEVLYLILLNDTRHPMGELRVAEGIPDHVAFDAKKLLRDIARTNSTHGILAHNHPNGIAMPSERDVITTQMLMHRLSQIGFTIVDHIIVAGEDACSMQARGRFPTIRSDSGIVNLPPSSSDPLSAYRQEDCRAPKANGLLRLIARLRRLLCGDSPTLQNCTKKREKQRGTLFCLHVRVGRRKVARRA